MEKMFKLQIESKLGFKPSPSYLCSCSQMLDVFVFFVWFTIFHCVVGMMVNINKGQQGPRQETRATWCLLEQDICEQGQKPGILGMPICEQPQREEVQIENVGTMVILKPKIKVNKETAVSLVFQHPQLETAITTRDWWDTTIML